MSEIADQILGITAAGKVNTTVFFNGERFVDFNCEFVRTMKLCCLSVISSTICIYTVASVCSCSL